MKVRNLDHKDDWQTPPHFYESLDAKYNFQFDPCPLHQDLDVMNGLEIEWASRNYVNPPYSRKLKDAFVAKAIEESKKGKLCVMLLPVSTSTILFHSLIKPNATSIDFVKGRIPFIGKNARGQSVNLHLLNPNVDMSATIEFEGKKIKKYVKNSGQHDSFVVVFDGRVRCDTCSNYVDEACWSSNPKRDFACWNKRT